LNHHLMCVVRVLCTAPLLPRLSTLSLHDALPISGSEASHLRPESFLPAHRPRSSCSISHRLPRFPVTIPLPNAVERTWSRTRTRSEEHTSELQSRFDLVCRLLLEKKKKKMKYRQR